MKLRVIHVFTHDSIGLGEDGPTHQTVEHVPQPAADPEPRRLAAGRRGSRRRWPGPARCARRDGPTALRAVAPEPARALAHAAGSRRGRARRLRAVRRAGRARRGHRHRLRTGAGACRRRRCWPPRASPCASSRCPARPCSTARTRRTRRGAAAGPAGGGGRGRAPGLLAQVRRTRAARWSASPASASRRPPPTCTALRHHRRGGGRCGAARRSTAEVDLAALIWDVDGTLAETEDEGHRVAFNLAFEEAGLPLAVGLVAVRRTAGRHRRQGAPAGLVGSGRPGRGRLARSR